MFFLGKRMARRQAIATEKNGQQDQGQQAWQNNQQGGTAKIRNVQLGADEYNEDTEVLSAVLQSKENTAMEGVDYRI